MSRNSSPTQATYQAPGDVPTVDVVTVRAALDAALEDWWRNDRLPSPELLRDSLYLLQAGHTLESAQSSLLLRAALAYHKGMLTTLRHQSDPERTAVILADALLALPPATLMPAELHQLWREDEHARAWMGALIQVLYEESSSADAGRRARALSLIDVLGGAAQWRAGIHGGELPVAVHPSWERTADTARISGTLLRAALLLLLLAGIAFGVYWLQQRIRLQNMIVVPAGAYPVSAGSGGTNAIADIAAFALDRTEVTNADYRRCMADGRCPQPDTAAGGTRANYLLDPAFDRFPVVNVDWHAASSYCAWAEKRLPTAAEWEVAAGYSPATQRQLVYPWGQQFQIQRANSSLTGLGDTQEVGSYRPAGDSSLGASDMAGNVAEWTATNVGPDQSGSGDRFLVKGGSYHDPAEALAVSSAVPLPASFSAPWLGIRCAVNVSDDSAAALVAAPQ